MADPTFETILYEVQDGIATITLNRPDRLNAWTPKMMMDLMSAFDHTDADDQVRCVIITGAGRGFCAGADLAAGSKTFAAGEREAERAALGDTEDVTRDGGGRFTLRLLESLKPVIAAVNGPAVGVGATMQLAMDIRIASTSARFGFVFARRGLTIEACSSWFLPRLVGVSTALEWAYSGRVFPAEEALQRGLVRSLHAPEDLLPAARSIAREIAGDRPGPQRGDAPADLARTDPRPPDGVASRRQSVYAPARGVCGRQGRDRLLPREAASCVSGPGILRHAGSVARLDPSRLQVN